jgi:methylated-DNA-[protein]-cysteine S-methyltransferase
VKQQAHRGVFKVREGWCAAAWTPKGLCALVLPQSSRATALKKLSSCLPPMPRGFWDEPLKTVPSKVRNLVRKALSGKPTNPGALDLFFLTPFQQRVLQATCQVPTGQTRSYGWVAGKAGSPRGYRAAGSALNRNPIPLLIPCHRITASGEGLGGYGGGIEWKIRLLEREGVRVVPGPSGGYRLRLP